MESNEGQVSQDYSKYQLVEVGDFAMNHMDLITGGVDIALSRGVTSPDYRVFSTRDGLNVHDRYFLYLFQKCLRERIFFAYGQGSSQLGRWRFPTDNFKDFRFPTPPPLEQEAISAFLDIETSKIDELVGENRRLIELLKEKRQAVVSHAVTKGLNPDAPMKPSGIEWLGDVPEHWKIISLKYLVSTPIIDGPHESPEKCDEGIPFVSAESASKGFLDFDKIWGYISREDHARFSKRYNPRIGDILMVKLGATTGTSAIVETEQEFSIWVPLAAIRLRPEFQPRFILHVLRSDNLRNAYQLSWTYGTQQTLGLQTISNLRLPIPPREERAQILIYLDAILPLFESLATEAQRAIDLLQERRTALISAAVTGKIDVRGLAESEAA